MASVVGLLEGRELAARERVEGLREEADRILAELADAERDWREWLIARQRVGEVLSVPQPELVADACAGLPTARAARSGSIVPVWRPALGADVLAVDYQRILAVLVELGAGGGGAMTCQEIAAALGLPPVPAAVEGVRSKMKRLADRGWAAEPAPGRFTLSASPVAGS